MRKTQTRQSNPIHSKIQHPSTAANHQLQKKISQKKKKKKTKKPKQHNTQHSHLQRPNPPPHPNHDHINNLDRKKYTTTAPTAVQHHHRSTPPPNTQKPKNQKPYQVDQQHPHAIHTATK